LKNLIIFMRHWGLILMGILLIIGGLIYGSIAQKTPYQNITKAFMAHYLSGRGIGYMQLEKSPTLYIVNEGQFLPAFSADYLNHGNVLISFLYRTDVTTNIDASSSNNVHLTGLAYTVEQLTLYHQFGQQPQVFSTFEYYQNPKGYYQHSWITGIALSLLGLIFIGLGLFTTVRRGKKKKQLDFVNTHASILAAADKQPEQLEEYQEPETITGNGEYTKYSTRAAQSTKISHAE
jgi:hypothetical protein